jgi:ribosomal protein L11 methyltransferase
MGSFTLTLEVAEGDADLRAAELFDQGAQGVEVRDRELAPMPGEPSPPPGRALLVAHFAARGEVEAAQARHGGAVAELPDQDWSETWKAGLAPFTVGAVFVRPSWVDAAPPPETVEVVLDPGMAFGTGTHPTTALCLAALAELVAARPGARVLDVGTGSGLLAIAAAKLGAREVVATENDPVALAVAGENAERNGVALALRGDPPERIPGRFDVVVANILANTLVELAPGLAERVAPGGTLLLSGILAGQEEEVRAAYLARGLAGCEDRADAEWRLLRLRRPG